MSGKQAKAKPEAQKATRNASRAPDAPQRKAGRQPERVLRLPSVKTIGTAGAFLGCSPDLVSEAKSCGCPGFAHYRIDLEMVVPWLLRWLEGGKKMQVNGQQQLPLDATVSPRKELDAWAAKLKRLQFEQRSGLLTGKDEVRAGIRATISQFFESLERVFCNELPPQIYGKREMQVRQECAKAVDELKKALKEGFGAALAVTGAGAAEESEDFDEETKT